MRLSVIILIAVGLTSGTVAEGRSNSTPPKTLRHSQAADLVVSFVLLTGRTKESTLEQFEQLAILSIATQANLMEARRMVREARVTFEGAKQQMRAVAMNAKFGRYQDLFPMRPYALTRGVNLAQCLGLRAVQIDVGFCHHGGRWKILVDPSVAQPQWPFKHVQPRANLPGARPTSGVATKLRLRRDRPKDWTTLAEQLVAALADKHRNKRVRRLLPTAAEVGRKEAKGALKRFSRGGRRVPGRKIPWANARLLAVDRLKLDFFGRTRAEQTAVLWIAANDKLTVWGLVNAKSVDGRLIIVDMPLVWHQESADRTVCQSVAMRYLTAGTPGKDVVAKRAAKRGRQCWALLASRPDARPLLNLVANDRPLAFFLVLEALLRRPPRTRITKMARKRKGTFEFEWKVSLNELLSTGVWSAPDAAPSPATAPAPDLGATR